MEELDKKQLSASIRQARQQLERMPHDLQLRERLGRLYLISGQVEHGLKALAQVAKARGRVGDYLEAIRLCNEILQYDPGRAEVALYLASLYAEAPELAQQAGHANTVTTASGLLRIPQAADRAGRSPDAEPQGRAKPPPLPPESAVLQPPRPSLPPRQATPPPVNREPVDASSLVAVHEAEEIGLESIQSLDDVIFLDSFEESSDQITAIKPVPEGLDPSMTPTRVARWPQEGGAPMDVRTRALIEELRQPDAEIQLSTLDVIDETPMVAPGLFPDEMGRSTEVSLPPDFDNSDADINALPDTSLDLSDFDEPDIGPPIFPPSESPLPEIPLLSSLPKRAFVEIMTRAARTTRMPGEDLVREGGDGDAIYIVLSGQVRVHKRGENGPVHLAHLGPGAFFGELALLSGRPRRATVTAEEPTEVFVIDAETLDDLRHRYPEVKATLDTFFANRLVGMFLATSPLFRALTEEARDALASRFKTRVLSPGQVLFAEGEVADGLYVICQGRLSVSRKSAPLVTVREGDFLGVVATLSQQPMTASAMAITECQVQVLEATALDQVLTRWPDVHRAFTDLAQMRRKMEEALDREQEG